MRNIGHTKKLIQPDGSEEQGQPSDQIMPPKQLQSPMPVSVPTPSKSNPTVEDPTSASASKQRQAQVMPQLSSPAVRHAPDRRQPRCKTMCVHN